MKISNDQLVKLIRELEAMDPYRQLAKLLVASDVGENDLWHTFKEMPELPDPVKTKLANCLRDAWSRV